MSQHKQYIGDGVYAEWDDFGAIVLTTEDGVRTTNRIVLERGVFQSLLNFWEAVDEEAAPDVQQEEPPA